MEKPNTGPAGQKALEPLYPPGSVGEWLLIWLENFRRPGEAVKESTYELYRSRSAHYLLPYVGDAPMQQADLDFWRRHFQFLRCQGRKDGQGGLSARTVHDVASLASMAMRQAACCGEAKSSMENGLPIPPAKGREMRVLTRQEQGRIEAVLRREEDVRAAAVWLSLYLGLRVGEVAGLRWGDVRLEQGFLAVRRTMLRIPIVGAAAGQPRTRLVVGEPKSESGRRLIPLPEVVLRLLHKRRQCLGARGAREEDYVICQPDGKYYEPRGLQRYFKKIAEQAQVPRANYHCLRHTFATRAVEVGMDTPTLKEIMGHARIETTMQYIHALDEHKIASMHKLDELQKETFF